MAARKNRPGKFSDRSFRKFPTSLKGTRVRAAITNGDYKVPEGPLTRCQVQEMILNLGLAGLRPDEDPLARYPVESKGFHWYKTLSAKVERATAESPMVARKGFKAKFEDCWEAFVHAAQRSGVQISEEEVKKVVKKTAPLIFAYDEGIVKTGDEPVITKEPVPPQVPPVQPVIEPANPPPAQPVQDENAKEPVAPPADDKKSVPEQGEQSAATEQVEKCSCGMTASRFIAVMEHGRYFSPKALCTRCLAVVEKIRYSKGHDTRSFSSRQEMADELKRLNGLVADAENMII